MAVSKTQSLKLRLSGRKRRLSEGIALEKITFVYPSRIFPGMIANAVNNPDAIFLTENFPENISFYVYAGVILENGLSYSISVDVLFAGETILGKEHSVTDSTAYHSLVTPQDDFISISCTWISSVSFRAEGIHEIKVTLYKGKIEDESDHVLDEHTAYILVRKNQVKN